MRRNILILIILSGLSLDAASDPYEFTSGFMDPALYGRKEGYEKVLNDPQMQPADFSRALTYLCEDLTRKVHTVGFAEKEKLCIDIANRLREKGADINAVNEFRTALRASIKNDLGAYFKFLLASGANVNLPDYRGETPLMHTTWQDQSIALRYAEALLKAGAKVNAKTKSGRTALHSAAYWGRPQLAQLFIKHGATLDVKDKEGLTPMHVAQVENRDGVVSVLKAAGAKVTPLPAKLAARRDKNAQDQKRADAQTEASQEKEKAKRKEEANKHYVRELNTLQVLLNAKAAKINEIESEMSAIGWSGPSFYSRTVTGYQCDVNNQNCRATHQGGGETVSSQWRRIDNEQKKRSLELKHSILAREYESLVYKYNAILKKMK